MIQVSNEDFAKICSILKRIDTDSRQGDDLSDIGGGTSIQFSTTVQLIKDCKEIREVIKDKYLPFVFDGLNSLINEISKEIGKIL